jgi:hypothetical protein
MMKEKNLKKLFKEEKIVSAIKRNSFFIISIFLFSLNNISAQIPINGFCRYREFSTKSNYTNLFPVDYNNDGYKKLLLLNSLNNNYASLPLNQKSNQNDISNKYSSMPISEIHPFGNESTTKRFLISSRKTREVAIASISKNGTFTLSNRIKLNGYPKDVDVADVDGDGKPEGLVSGPSLNGLFILKENKNILKERHVVEGKVFSSSCLIDLDYNSYYDIAALDMLTNSIILYSNQFGNFVESRSIGLNGKIEELKAIDFNSDGFTDLAYINGNHFEFLLGDSISSFRKKFILNVPVEPDKYTILDFNGDGYNDIAFINSNSGELYISFAKVTNSFYPPILYLKKAGLVDIISFLDRGGKKLAVLSNEGKVFLINSVGIGDDSFSMTFGQKPSAFQTFDYLNDKYEDFCFIDNEERSLKIFLSERRNLFRTFYNVPVSESYSSISVDNVNERIKTFFCYSNGGRSIEIVRMNFDEHKYSRQILYTLGPIEDFKLLSDRLKDWQNVFVLIKKDNHLYAQSFELRDFQLAATDIAFISSNFEKAWLTFNIYKEIYFIRRNNDKYELVKTIFDRKILESQMVLNFNTKLKDEINYDLIGIDELIDRAKPVAFLFSINKKNDIYILSKDQIKKYPIRSQITSNPILKYNINNSGEEISFYFNEKIKNKLKTISFREVNKAGAEKDVIESKNIYDYLISNINRSNTFLIYSNSFQNTLTFEKL